MEGAIWDKKKKSLCDAAPVIFNQFLHLKNYLNY